MGMPCPKCGHELEGDVCTASLCNCYCWQNLFDPGVPATDFTDTVPEQESDKETP